MPLALLALISLLAAVIPVTSCAGDPVELLRDPHFTNGVRVATRSNYPPNLQADARARWLQALPATANACWEFIEIAELQNLSDNPATPEVRGPRITYSSRDRNRRLEINTETGKLRYVIDTEREWRGACNMSGLQDGVAPRFCNGKAWNWPHFLLSQAICDPRQPTRPLPLSEYPKLTFSITAELASCAMGRPNPCPRGAWGDQEVGNHCLFYVDFVIVHKNPQVTLPDGKPAARLIFALYPLFCSWDGKTHSSPAPWLGLDPAGQAVYWTPNLHGLELNRRADVAIDVQNLAREAVAEINKRYHSSLSAGDYNIAEAYLGWEIWGPFRCDISLRNLSFRAEHRP